MRVTDINKQREMNDALDSVRLCVSLRSPRYLRDLHIICAYFYGASETQVRGAIEAGKALRERSGGCQ